MKKKTAYPMVHLLALLLTPMMFACAHATTENVDGLTDLGTSGTSPTLSEPVAMEGFELGQELPEANAQQIAAAQKAINKNRKAHKKVTSPFAEAAVRSLAAQPKVVAQQAPEAKAIGKVVTGEHAVVRNGSTLNRYYFLRAGDSPEHLSKLFYGSSDRAAELVEWNGPSTLWEAGQTIYYRSARAAEDTHLISYYMEAQVPTEQVVLLPGDTLQTFASQRYGAAGSWKEVAALNGLRDGAMPDVGAAFKAYPAKLLKEEKSTVASVESLAPAAPAPTAKPEGLKARLASSGIAGFIRNNPLAVACSLVALVLMAGYFFAQRRRYGRFDF